MADPTLFTSMAGLETAQSMIDTVSENVSNVDTTGYAAAQTAALAAPYAGEDSLAGADVIPLDEGTDTKGGPMRRTGDPFDIAVTGGWLLVQAGGGLAVTRNGALRQDPNGLLVTANGNPVLDSNQQPISLPPLKSMQVSSDGTISGIPAGGEVEQSVVYDTLYLAATPADGALAPLGGTLYGLRNGAQPTAAVGAKVRQGYLEGSNVDPVHCMIEMIAGSRAFELLSQTIATASGTQQSLNQVLAATS